MDCSLGDQKETCPYFQILSGHLFGGKVPELGKPRGGALWAEGGCSGGKGNLQEAEMTGFIQKEQKQAPPWHFKHERGGGYNDTLAM